MNLDSIRNQLKSLINQDHEFYYTGLRGQNEKFIGRIIHVYPRVVLIQTSNGDYRSFSYSDFATHILKILE